MLMREGGLIYIYALLETMLHLEALHSLLQTALQRYWSISLLLMILVKTFLNLRYLYLFYWYKKQQFNSTLSVVWRRYR